MNLLRFTLLFALICVAWSISVSIPESVDSDIEVDGEAGVELYMVSPGSVNNPAGRQGNGNKNKDKGSGNGASKKVTPPCSFHGFSRDKVICSCAWVDNISQCNATANFDPRKYQLNQNLDSKLVYSPGADYPTLTGQSDSNCDASTSVGSETTIEGVLCALGCICY